MATDGTCVTKAVQPDPPPPSLPVVTIVTSSKMSSGAQQPPPMAATTATTTTAWMMSEEEASAAMAAAAGGGGDSGGQAVFVTVDTTQAPFPEMPIMVEATTTATDSLSQQQPLMTEQEALRAMGTLEAPPPPQIVVATKLDDLADAASVHAAPLITQQQQQQLVCGDCSAAFQDGEVLFQHWLEQHCRPQQQQRQVSSQQQEQQQKDRLELEQCCTCNHVFVKGTQRLADHVAKCAAKTPQGETPTAAASSLKRKSQEDLSCKQTPAPATPSKVSKRPGSSSSSSSSSLSMVSCGVCSTDVKTVTSFFLHWLDAHHQIVEVLEEVWQCGQCRPNRLFPSAPRLSAHVSEAHPFRRNVYQCGELDCGARYATMAEVEAHQHRVHHRQQGDGEGSPMEDECCRSAEVAGDLGAHFRKKHETTCELCGCQVEWCGSGASGGEMRSHLAQVHAFENVWNRSDSLSRITVTEAGGTGRTYYKPIFVKICRMFYLLFKVFL